MEAATKETAIGCSGGSTVAEETTTGIHDQVEATKGTATAIQVEAAKGTTAAI